MVNGSIWSVGGFGGLQLIRLAGNIALAWLLVPEDFGLALVVTTIMMGLEMLSDVGLAASVMQNRRGHEPAFLNNIWTLQILRGLTLWSIAAMLAYPVSLAYGEPRLLYLVPLAGLASIFRGFKSTKLLWNQRHLRYGYNTLVEIVSRLVGVVGMVLLAWWLRDVVALVCGGIITSLTVVALSHTILPGPANRLAWHGPTIREVIRFGKWIYISTVMTFVGMQGDKLLFPLLEGMGVVGVYAMAVGLAQLPAAVVDRLTKAVLLPALARHHRERPETFADKVALTRRTIILAATVVILALVLLASPFFELLYPNAFRDAGWMTQLICIGVWFEMLRVMSARALVSRGTTWPLAASNGANACVTFVACLVGFHFMGVPGFILGFAGGTISGYLVVQYAMLREKMSMWSQDLRFSVVLLGLVACGMTAQIGLMHVGPPHAAAWMQVLGAAVVLGIYGVWAGRMVARTLFGSKLDGLWQIVEHTAGGRLAWAVPRRYRGL